MRQTGYSRQTGARELDVQCNGYGPSFHMEHTHFHDCFEMYLQIEGGPTSALQRQICSCGTGGCRVDQELRPAPVLCGPGLRRHPGRAVFFRRLSAGCVSERADGLLALFTGPFQILRLDVAQQRKALELLYEMEQRKKRRRISMDGLCSGTSSAAGSLVQNKPVPRAGGTPALIRNTIAFPASSPISKATAAKSCGWRMWQKRFSFHPVT